MTTDGKVVEMFLEDGRRKPEKSMFAPEEPMDNIMYCRETKQFVGWKKGEDELFVSVYSVVQELIKRLKKNQTWTICLYTVYTPYITTSFHL